LSRERIKPEPRHFSAEPSSVPKSKSPRNSSACAWFSRLAALRSHPADQEDRYHVNANSPAPSLPASAQPLSLWRSDYRGVAQETLPTIEVGAQGKPRPAASSASAKPKPAAPAPAPAQSVAEQQPKPLTQPKTQDQSSSVRVYTEKQVTDRSTPARRGARNRPGLVIAQHSGSGKANQYSCAASRSTTVTTSALRSTACPSTRCRMFTATATPTPTS